MEENSQGSFALVMLLPPQDSFADQAGLPTETLFIIDVSGSMEGPSIRQAREALLASLSRLGPGDSFNLLTFNDSVTVYQEDFVEADKVELRKARNWVSGLVAGGGTMIRPALETGMRMTRTPESGRVRRIVFMTDGAVSNEDQVLATVRRELGGTRLHTLGIGHAPNRYLMRKIASFGHGLCGFIPGNADASNLMDVFLRRLDRPVATALSLEWEGARPWDLYPERLPDLHAGEPVYISARFPAGEKPTGVRMTGIVNGGKVERFVDLANRAPERSGIGVRWARARIGSLLDSVHEGADADKVRRQVVDLSKKFNVVTPFTSLVAVEEFSSANSEARTVKVPGTLPAGGTLEPLLLLLGILATVVGAVGALAFTSRGRP